MLSEKVITTLGNSDYRLKSFEKYSLIDKPKWKRVGHQVEEPAEFKPFNNISLQNEVQEGLIVKNIDESLTEIARLSNDNNDYGLGDYFSNQINTFYNEGKYVKVLAKKEIKDPLYISYTTNSENNVLIDYNLIEVEEFGKVTIIITYNSEDEAKAYHNGVIKVMARANSEVKIIKVQTLNLESENYESSKIEVLGGGKVSMYTVELGAKVNGVSHKTYLEEDNASASIWPAYLADKDRKVDLEYSVVFRGRRGNGEIQGRGAVKGTSKKVFRGNLYFKRGSSKSEGNEGEFAILLDKTVKADSIPTLFCDEDDVIGAHSASIGKVDESKLFYLMSRGLTESRAKKHIVKSSIRPILKSKNDDEIRNKILNELENRI